MRVNKQISLYTLCSLLGLTILSFLVLSHTPTYTLASSSFSDPLSITVASACTLSSSNNSYSEQVISGNDAVITGEPIITVCNDASGYALYVVGYSGDSYIGDNTKMLSSINSTYNISTNTSGTDSYWAMKVNPASGADPTVTNSFDDYHTIPEDYMKVATYGSNTTSGSTGSSVIPTYKIHVSTTQVAGSYTGKVKYTLVHPNNAAAPEIPKTYMQDLTLAQCQKNVGTNGNPAGIGDNITVYDRRDGSDYTVRYINGECWMTQNLRYLGDTGSAAKTMTIGNNNSNVANKDITLYSLNSSNAGRFNAYSSHCDNTNSYNYACVYDSGSTSIGVWYNYYAASAGTISGLDNQANASQDICPKNWHLPSGPNSTIGTDLNKLIGNTTSDWQNVTDGLSAFGIISTGAYWKGSLADPTWDDFWSATAVNSSSHHVFMYALRYNGSQYSVSSRTRNSLGLSVRCVRSV